MAGTSNPETISTRLRRVAELSRNLQTWSGRRWPTTSTLISSRRLQVVRKDGAVGVDEQTAEEYAVNLEENLKSLENRFKSGSYKAPPVRRASIPKGDGKEPGRSAFHVRGQDPAAGCDHGSRGSIRAGLSGLLLRVSTGPFGTSSPGLLLAQGHVDGRRPRSEAGYRKVFRCAGRPAGGKW